MNKRLLPLLYTLLAVIALSASIAYWAMELYKPAQRPLAAMPQASVPDPAPDAGATLFGGQAMAVMASNYQLTGVIASGANGVAILVADGQPAKAVPVGRELSPGVIIKEVQPRYVMLSEGGILKRIELAADDKAAAAMGVAPPSADQYQQQPQPTPMPQPMQVPQNQPQTSLPAQNSNEPMDVPAQPQPQALPPGMPPPPPSPSPEMPRPVRNFSNSGTPAPPNQ